MEKDNSIPDDVKREIDIRAELMFPTEGLNKFDKREPLQNQDWFCQGAEFGYNLAFKALSDLKAENEKTSWSLMLVKGELDAYIKDAVKKDLEITSFKKESERLKDKLEAAKLALKEIYTGTDFPLSIAQNALQILEIK